MRKVWISISIGILIFLMAIPILDWSILAKLITIWLGLCSLFVSLAMIGASGKQNNA